MTTCHNGRRDKWESCSWLKGDLIFGENYEWGKCNHEYKTNTL